MSVISFRYHVRLGSSMVFESIYPKELQLSRAQKVEFFQNEHSIIVWLMVDGKLAGESYGMPVMELTEPIEGLGVLEKKERQSSVYCYSNTILPPYQKQGFGIVLKAHWLGLVAGRGFNTVYGHARQGGSRALNAKFGATFLERFADWYGTGEPYWLYRLRL